MLLVLTITGASPVLTEGHKVIKQGQQLFLVYFSILSDMAYYLAGMAPVLTIRRFF